LAGRGQPRFDSEPAPGATRGDLDPELVDEFVGTCRAGSEQLSRIRERDELLWRMGVLVGDDRVPSIAGLLALGSYPQQHLPALSLQATLVGHAGAGERARDARRFDGPIPRILADAVAWVARSSPTAIRTQPDGAVVD